MASADGELGDELSADATTLFTIGDFGEAARLWTQAARLFDTAGKDSRAAIARRACDRALEAQAQERSAGPSPSLRLQFRPPEPKPRESWHEKWKEEWKDLDIATERFCDRPNAPSLHFTDDNPTHDYNPHTVFRYEEQEPMRNVAKAFQEVVDIETGKQFQSRSDFVNEARRAWASHPEWAETERIVSLDDDVDIDEWEMRGSRHRITTQLDDIFEHEPPVATRPMSARPPSTAKTTVRKGQRSKTQRKWAAHSLGKSPNIYDHSWTDIDEMWLKRNRERQAVHFYPDFPDEMTKSEFKRRMKLKDNVKKPEINSWGTPRAECLCHDWKGPKGKKPRVTSTPPHPNNRSRRMANRAHDAKSVGWKADPDGSVATHFEDSPSQGTVYHYTPQPLYRHEDRDSSGSSHRGRGASKNRSTAELLEEFNDTMDGALEKTTVGFYSQLPPADAMNLAMH